jgi:hypothetical protein
MRTSILILGASFALSSLVSAQVVKGSDGLGKDFPNGTWLDASSKPTHKLDIEKIVVAATSTAFNGFLGVCRDRVKKNYWVTCRGVAVSGVTKHRLFEFDSTGKLVGNYDQPSAVWYDTTKTPATGSSWGIRDLASNGLYIYGGCENTVTGNKVFAFNVVTKKWDATKDWKVPAATGNSTVRALAFDPNGNKGKGSMWSTNWSGALEEFAQDGTMLRKLTGPPIASPSSYGACYDPVRKTVWWFGQGGSAVGTSSTSAPHVGCRVVGYELDTKPTVPVFTGSMFFGDQSIPASSTTYPPGGIAGGCDFFTDAKGRPVLLCLTQSASDTIYEMYGRFQHGPNKGGEIVMKGDAPYFSNTKWSLGVENSKGVAAVLLLGTASWNLPVSAPFTAGDILRLWLPGGLFVMGSAPIASGSALINVPLPPDPSLNGKVLFWQFAEVNKDATISLSTGGFHRIF